MSRQATKMNFETLQMYRNEMQNIKFHIIDEVSMVGAHTLNTAHIRLQDVYMIYDVPYGGVNVLVSGDLMQLPPVNARAVFKP
ncbi:hypothetical protein pipiens_004919, partial [Culex pipiens pipiens]